MKITIYFVNVRNKTLFTTSKLDIIDLNTFLPSIEKNDDDLSLGLCQFTC